MWLVAHAVRALAYRGIAVLSALLWFTGSFLAPSAEAAGVVSGPDRISYVLDFKQLGHTSAVPLRGVDDRRGVAFGVRADQRVRRLVLELAYLRSSALLEEYSHLNVLLNGEVVLSHPLSAAEREENRENQVSVELPLHLLRADNMLELQLIGHYALSCEDPRHSDLWVDILNGSRLLFDVDRIVLPNDLALLPAPFFDKRDVRRLELPFAISSVSDSRLEAAAILASWFGAKADYRGAHFEVAVDELPASGHAVYIGNSADDLMRFDVPAPKGPSVAIRPHPADPAGKLLVITGRNDDEIRQAAMAVAVGEKALAGDHAAVVHLEVEPRRPYDAPNWLPSDRPVAFGELAPVSDLTRDGYTPAPINIPLRLPPDLSNWRVKDVPIELLYRHSARPSVDAGVLDIAVNYYPVQRIQLGDDNEAGWQWVSGDESVLRRATNIPLSILGSTASLQYQFTYSPPPQKACRGKLVDDRRSAIDPASTIDISGFPHFKAMPDLAAFVTAGFPFTRMADLSDTVVLLAQSAGSSEYTTLLDWMGNIGRSTGYPAVNVDIRRGDISAQEIADKDVLLIDSGGNLSLLAEWAAYLPKPKTMVKNGASDNVQAQDESDWGMGEWFDWVSTWFGKPRDPTGSINPTSPQGPVYLAGFESPLADGRSVVVVAGETGAHLKRATESLIGDAEQTRRVQGALVTVQDDRVEVLSRAKPYFAGQLNMPQAAMWFLSHHPAALFLLYLFAAALAGTVFYMALSVRARHRLKIGQGGDQDEGVK